MVIVLDDLQRFASVHPRHVEIEQNKPRKRRLCSVGETALPAQIGDKLLPVLDEAQLVAKLVLLESVLKEHPIVRVVLGYENGDGRTVPGHDLLSEIP